MTAYPKEWERHEILRDGTRVFVRPLRPEDGKLYPELFSGITPEDLRLRFFAPVRQFDEAAISRLVNIDYDQAMAFVAIDEDSGNILGVVRLHLEAAQCPEYAVIVRSQLKGRGLGWLLMQQMIEYAKSRKLKRICGQVLSENTTMLSMCAELGFHIVDDLNTRGVKIVTLTLGGDDAATPPPP